MSCEHEREVLELDTEWTSGERAVLLRAHLEACPSCAAAWSRVQAARAGLRATPRLRLEDRERAAIWASVQEAREGASNTGFFAHWRLSLAMAAAAAVLFAWLAGGKEQPPRAPWTLARGVASAGGAALSVGAELPRGAPLALAEGAQLLLAKGTVEAPAAAWLELAPLTAQGTLLRLEEGRLQVALGAGEHLEIETPQAHLAGVGAVFEVAVEQGRTQVRAVSGQLIAGGGGQAQRALASGESFEARRIETALGEAAPTPGPEARAAESPARATQEREPPQALDRRRPAPRRAPLAEAPLPPATRHEEEVAALIERADEARRAGALGRAVELYQRVAELPAGRAFAEEATLRAALLLPELERSAEALQLLAEARQRFGGGELGPERTALEVRLLLERGRPGEAADRLLASRSAEGAELAVRRVEVAEALVEADPARARAVLAPVLAAAQVPSLARRARALEGRLRQSTDEEQR